MTDKEWALDLVKQFDARWGAGVWTHIERAALAKGLRERLNDPDALDQGITNLCGMASFVREWLQDDPIGYVWLAICLYEKGVGNLDRRGAPGESSDRRRNSRTRSLPKSRIRQPQRLSIPPIGL